MTFTKIFFNNIKTPIIPPTGHLSKFVTNLKEKEEFFNFFIVNK